MIEPNLNEQAVTFASGGLTFSGTLTTPTPGSPAPAVLLLPGSGRTDRDDNAKSLAINLFPPLVAAFSRLGFATFRFDKRGVAASEGDYWATGFDDVSTDADAALEWLSRRVEVNASRIVVLGHSEGALVSVRLAANNANVAEVILLGGSAKTGEDTLMWQGRQIAASLTGFNKFVIKALRIDVVKAQQKSLDRLKATTTDVVRIQLQKVNAKWMREFLAYDPASDLAKVEVPVLAITGANDIQVDPDDLLVMKDLIPAEVEAHMVPDVTHLLRADPAKSGLKGYRKQAKLPIDRRVVEYVTTWLKARESAPQR